VDVVSDHGITDDKANAQGDQCRPIGLGSNKHRYDVTPRPEVFGNLESGIAGAAEYQYAAIRFRGRRRLRGDSGAGQAGNEQHKERGDLVQHRYTPYIDAIVPAWSRSDI
jgi:hypothetical protein